MTNLNPNFCVETKLLMSAAAARGGLSGGSGQDRLQGSSLGVGLCVCSNVRKRDSQSVCVCVVAAVP